MSVDTGNSFTQLYVDIYITYFLQFNETLYNFLPMYVDRYCNIPIDVLMSIVLSSENHCLCGKEVKTKSIVHTMHCFANVVLRILNI